MSSKSQFRRVDGRGTASLVCPVCEKHFTRPHAHLRGYTACCSQNCSRKIKPKKPKTLLEFICLGCGAKFQRRKGYGGPGKYCSITCRQKFSVPKGKSHPRWKGGISERTHAVRQVIIDRLKQIDYCERCGSRDNLHGHHIKSYADHPGLRTEISNIEILCVDCHAKEHPRQKKLILSRAYTSQK